MRSDEVRSRMMYFEAMGRTKEEMEKPLIAIVNSPHPPAPEQS